MAYQNFILCGFYHFVIGGIFYNGGQRLFAAKRSTVSTVDCKCHIHIFIYHCFQPLILKIVFYLIYKKIIEIETSKVNIILKNFSDL